MTHLSGVMLLVSTTACEGAQPGTATPPAICDPGYRIVAQHPHDPRHFTQGLLIADGDLFESVGQYGESAVYRKSLRGGELLDRRSLPDPVFGEGLARIGMELFVLTWRENAAYVLNLALEPRRQLRYAGEGWGLTAWPTPAGERLVMSDGSASLRVLHPLDFAVLDRLTVREGAVPLAMLNELEFARGKIYANVWKQDRIVAIDPVDGRVVQSIDLSALPSRLALPPGWNAKEDVLNGIAYDEASGHFFVTGKRWPALFELAVKECGAVR